MDETWMYTTMSVAIAAAGFTEEDKTGYTLFSGFSCPIPNPWEYMGVQLLYIKEQTAKSVDLAVFQFLYPVLIFLRQ